MTFYPYPTHFEFSFLCRIHDNDDDDDDRDPDYFLSAYIEIALSITHSTKIRIKAIIFPKRIKKNYQQLTHIFQQLPVWTVIPFHLCWKSASGSFLSNIAAQCIYKVKKNIRFDFIRIFVRVYNKSVVALVWSVEQEDETGYIYLYNM